MEVAKRSGLLNIIEVLKCVQDRVGMYIGRTDDVNSLVCFLQGFFTACDALGLRYDGDVRHQVFSENGWESRADGVWLQMREKGMSEEAIVQELVSLEVLKWRKLLAEATTE